MEPLPSDTTPAPVVASDRLPATRRAAAVGLANLLALLRWNRPSGRLILFIPAGWALWLAPVQPPSAQLVLQLLLGGVAVSGAGCIANDLWDRRIDRQVQRTRQRPLASGALGTRTALIALAIALLISLCVVLTLPHRWLCLLLALSALPLILLYPAAKRVFAYPQLVLSCTWGFAVLIPWAAAVGRLSADPVLVATWLATVLWTFGFDTVYAMADRSDDARIGVGSSALSLGRHSTTVVAACYGLMMVCLAVAAQLAAAGGWWWPIWWLAVAGMGREVVLIHRCRELTTAFIGHRFAAQVRLGGLLLLGLVLASLQL